MKAEELAHVLSDVLLERGLDVESWKGVANDVYVVAWEKNYDHAFYRVTGKGEILFLGKPDRKIQKIVEDSGIGKRLGEDRPRRIEVFYGLITPESAEDGDYAERGEDHIEDIDPNPTDEETYVDAAVKYLRHEGAADSGGGDWFTLDTEPNYRTGDVTTYDFLLRDFEPEEEEEIWKIMTKGRTSPRKMGRRG